MMVAVVRMCWWHSIVKKRKERRRFTPGSGKYAQHRNDRCANGAAHSALGRSLTLTEPQAYAPAQRERHVHVQRGVEHISSEGKTCTQVQALQIDMSGVQWT